MKSGSVIHNVVYNVIKAFANLILPLLTYSYCARILQKDGLGKVEFARSFVAYFVMLAMLGIVNYATREASRIRDDKAELSKFALEIIIINFISVMGTYLILFLMVRYIPFLHNYSMLIMINSASVFLSALGMEWLYNAVEDYKYIAIRTIFFQFVVFIMVILFVHSSSDIYKYAIIMVLSSTGSNVFNFIHSCKYIDYKWYKQIELKKHIKPIFALFGMTVFVQVFSNLDITMLGIIHNDVYVGLYSAATKMVNVICSLLVAFTAVLMPRISYYLYHNENDSVKKLSYQAIDYLLMISVPACLGLILLTPQIITIFSGYSFLNATLAGRILSLRVVLSPINTFYIVQLFIPMKKDVNCIIATGFSAFVNIVLNFLLIPHFYQSGAACATLIAEAIELVFNFYSSRHILKLKESYRNLYAYLIGCVPILLIWLGGRRVVGDSILLMIIIIPSILAYILVLKILHIQSYEEIVERIVDKVHSRNASNFKG